VHRSNPCMLVVDLLKGWSLGIAPYTTFSSSRAQVTKAEQASAVV
jgi:hypothetical protein